MSMQVMALSVPGLSTPRFSSLSSATVFDIDQGSGVTVLFPVAQDSFKRSSTPSVRKNDRIQDLIPRPDMHADLTMILAGFVNNPEARNTMLLKEVARQMEQLDKAGSPKDSEVRDRLTLVARILKYSEN